MQSEKEVEVTVETLANRIKEVQQSILTLLNKLEMQDKLEWPMYFRPAMLESFAVLSSQFNSLMQILQNSRTPNLRNLVLLPIRLSPDVDPGLQTLTDNRLTVWSHAVVPDYLRTKLDDRIEEGPKRVLSQQGPRITSNPESLQKTVNQMNKTCGTTYDLIMQATKDELDVEGAKLNETSNLKDTEQLVAAVTVGVGLKVNISGSGQSQSGGKYASSVKTALNQVAAKVGQPYTRN